MAAVAVAAVAAPSAAGLYHVVHKFADDKEFRRWLQRDYASGARFFEGLLEDYYPKLLIKIRIDEDVEYGDDELSSSSAAAAAAAPTARGADGASLHNLGEWAPPAAGTMPLFRKLH
eukprot:3302869-Prymnesium_polylepis.1